MRETLTIISPRLNTEVTYFISNKKRLNLKNPQSLDDKISWLKLNVYNNDALVKMCADKFHVREYLVYLGLNRYLNDLFGVYMKYDEIDWNALPNEFVLKWSSGNGFNYICKDKDQINHTELRREVLKWQKSKPYLKSSEMHYKVASPRLVCEKYLGVGNKLPTDYKIYCFHGKAVAIRVMAERETELAGVFMSRDWQKIDGLSKFKTLHFVPEKPKCLEKMMEISEILSKPFPFVRVDLYVVEEKIYFGEMTFTPSAGNKVLETRVNGIMMSELLDYEASIINPMNYEN